MLHRLILSGHDVGAPVLEYARRQWQRPSVRAFAEHARPKEVPDSYWAMNGMTKLEQA